MAIRDDERAQSVQVGAVLLLGTVVVALSVYQVTSVPGQNADTEFTHNQRVHEQLQEVRAAILETAAEGTGRSATVALGTQYRDRVVAVNPGPPSGTLRTTDLGAVAIENAVAVGNDETADFWNGSVRRYASTALTYEPNYNEYREAPTTVYEHSVLVDRFDDPDRTLLLSNETVIDGRDITLSTLSGSLSESGSGTVAVDTRPLSVSSTTVPIRSVSGDPITISFPTTLPESRWRALIGNATFVEDLSYVERSPYDLVTIRLRPGETYRLRMAKVGIGNGGEPGSPAYLTDLPDDDPIPENGSRRVRVEVRDRYNNPVANETVNFTIMAGRDGDPPGQLSIGNRGGETVTVTTDERGRASATYRAPRSIDGDPVSVVIGASRVRELDPGGSLDSRSPNTVRFAFDVTNADGSPAPYSVEWNRTALAARPGLACGAGGCTYNRSVGTLAAPITTVPATPNTPFAVESTDRTVATAAGRTDRTGADGTATARIDVFEPGTTRLRVSSGGSNDTLSLTTENRPPEASIDVSPGTPRSSELVSFSADATDPDGQGAPLEYEWEFGDGSRGFGPTPQHAYDRGGIYEVSLTVTDAYGANATVNRTITVSNRAPEAAIDYDPLAPRVGETVAFSGARSTDPDGEIASYEWTFGDGTTTTGTTPRHAYEGDGNYTVSLTVTDDDGATATARTEVTVDGREPIPNREPRAAFAIAPTDPRTGDRIRFDASGSVDNGEITSYDWELTYPSGRTATTTGETVTANPLPPGEYRMTLTVTDEGGGTDTTSETFSVTSRPPGRGPGSRPGASSPLGTDQRIGSDRPARRADRQRIGLGPSVLASSD